MRRRARCLLALAGAVAAIAVPVVASAHPLGNFTVNHYTGIEVAGNQLRLHYVLDLAEIPAYQERQRIDDAGAGYLDARVAAIARNLRLTVDGTTSQLHPASRRMLFLPGQGGLQTLRIEALFTSDVATGGEHSGSYSDSNDAGRIGWREITVRATGGARIVHADVPPASVTDELRRYPQDMLSSPLDVRQASFSFTRGSAAVAPAALGPLGGGFSRVQDSFAALVAQDHASWAFVVFALAAAMGLGAAHALSPGHGKAVVAGYMVGSQRGWRSAVLLGGTITATHTSGVFAFGLVTLYASSWITPERLYPWLTLASGLLVLVMGVWLVIARSRAALGSHAHDHAHDHHHHGAVAHRHVVPSGRHPHHHGDDHVHAGTQRRVGSATRTPAPLGRAGVVGLGVAGGLLPCPSALVVLLAAISLHRIAFGLLLIVAFSTGLALVLVGIGLAVAHGTLLVQRLPRRRLPAALRAARLLPVASALVVCLAGIGLFSQALPSLR